MRRGETPILFVAEVRTEEAAAVEGGAVYMRAVARAAALSESGGACDGVAHARRCWSRARWTNTGRTVERLGLIYKRKRLPTVWFVRRINPGTPAERGRKDDRPMHIESSHHFR